MKWLVKLALPPNVVGEKVGQIQDESHPAKYQWCQGPSLPQSPALLEALHQNLKIQNVDESVVAMKVQQQQSHVYDATWGDREYHKGNGCQDCENA